MNAEQTNTEGKILEAAKEVFIQKGLEGARMQEIADTAGINKALLHYYYRTKEKLFSAVFHFAISRFIPHIEEAFSSDKSINEIIRTVVYHYITLIQKNQFIPIFILHEINRNPDRIVEIMRSSGINPDLFINAIQKEIDEGKIKISSPQQLIINIISLCIFPFVARPLMLNLFFSKDKKQFNDFIEVRKKEVADFIIAAIQPDKN